MIIKTWRDPYDEGFSPTRPKEIEINQGVTVLVGCNGAGKTTLLRNIKEEMEKNDIPVHLFDNLKNNSKSNFMSIIYGYSEFDCDNVELGISLFNSSEGEAISLNISRESTVYNEFLDSGYFKNKSNKFSMLFNKKETKDKTDSNKRFFLYDATDSGLSIDNIIQIKNLFELILKKSKEKGLETYIIISANEYELCRNENCFDVNKGKYITFKDYEDYRKFIIQSRNNKEKRIERCIAWRKKQREKQLKKYYELEKDVFEKIRKIKAKYKDGEKISWSDKFKIDDEERRLKDFISYNRFVFDSDRTKMEEEDNE